MLLALHRKKHCVHRLLRPLQHICVKYHRVTAAQQIEQAVCSSEGWWFETLTSLICMSKPKMLPMVVPSVSVCENVCVCVCVCVWEREFMMNRLSLCREDTWH